MDAARKPKILKRQAFANSSARCCPRSLITMTIHVAGNRSRLRRCRQNATVALLKPRGKPRVSSLPLISSSPTESNPTRGAFARQCRAVVDLSHHRERTGRVSNHVCADVAKLRNDPHWRSETARPEHAITTPGSEQKLARYHRALFPRGPYRRPSTAHQGAATWTELHFRRKACEGDHSGDITFRSRDTI